MALLDGAALVEEGPRVCWEPMYLTSHRRLDHVTAWHGGCVAGGLRGRGAAGLRGKGSRCLI